MAYDERVAQRVRKAMTRYSGVSEKRMFGGIAFMHRGHMCCGVIGEKLMVRVGADGYEEALSQPHAGKMDFTGKPMNGFVYVEPAGFASEADLHSWIGRGARFTSLLPSR